eukprot:5417893-Prymnesium_polylepis.1
MYRPETHGAVTPSARRWSPTTRCPGVPVRFSTHKAVDRALRGPGGIRLALPTHSVLFREGRRSHAHHSRVKLRVRFLNNPE